MSRLWVALSLVLFAGSGAAEQIVVRDCEPGTVISGLEVDGGRFGILAINCPGVIIENNQVSFNGLADGEDISGGGGIVLYESPGGIVRNNRITSNSLRRTGVGIRVHRSDSSWVHMNNVDLRGERNVVDGECIAVNSADSLIERNTLRGCPGHGILLWGGVANTTHRDVVVDNVIIDPGYGLKWIDGAWRNWAYPGVTVISKGSLVTDATIARNLRVHTGDPQSRDTDIGVHVVGGCDGCDITGE